MTATVFPFAFVPTFSWPSVPGALLFTYAAGGSTPQATYSDALGTVPNSNPVELDVTGSATVRLDPSLSYHLVLKDPTGATTLWDQDNYESPFYGTVPTNLPPSYAATAAETSVAAPIVNSAYPPMCVDRYFTNTGTNDSAPAFGMAFKVAQASGGGTITYGATAPYMTLSPINFTSVYGAYVWPTTLQGPGLSTMFATPSIIANHGGNSWNHVIDLTNTLGFVMKGVSIGTRTTGTTFPTTGIFQARGSGGSSTGICKFHDVSIVGQFTNACYYNFAAEDCDHFGMHFYNAYTGGPCRTLVITSNNVSGLTSTYQPVYGAGAVPTPASCLNHRFFGGEFYNTSSNALSDVFYFDGIGSFRAYGIFSFASGGCRSNVYCEQTYAPSTLCRFDAMKTDTANIASYVFAFSENAGDAVGWQFDNMNTNCTTLTIAALGGSGVQGMNGWRVGSWVETAAKGMVWPGTATSCYFNTGEMAITIGTAGIDNVFIGDIAQLTITGSGSFTVLNSRAGQQPGWGGVSGAAVVNNYNVSTSTTTQDKQAIASLIAMQLARGGFAP